MIKVRRIPDTSKSLISRKLLWLSIKKPTSAFSIQMWCLSFLSENRKARIMLDKKHHHWVKTQFSALHSG
jgi:hypothetical protein